MITITIITAIATVIAILLFKKEKSFDLKFYGGFFIFASILLLFVNLFIMPYIK